VEPSRAFSYLDSAENLRAIFMARAGTLAQLLDSCVTPASSLLFVDQLVEAGLIKLTLLVFKFPPFSSTTTEHVASCFPRTLPQRLMSSRKRKSIYRLAGRWSVT